MKIRNTVKQNILCHWLVLFLVGLNMVSSTIPLIGLASCSADYRGLMSFVTHCMELHFLQGFPSPSSPQHSPVITSLLGCDKPEWHVHSVISHRTQLVPEAPTVWSTPLTVPAGSQLVCVYFFFLLFLYWPAPNSAHFLSSQAVTHQGNGPAGVHGVAAHLHQRWTQPSTCLHSTRPVTL